MTDDVRAAAERLREHRRVVAAMEHSKASPYTYIDVSTGAAGFVPNAELRDMAAVVTAYLAEHPADDAEPVTEAWLRAVEWEQIRDGPHWWLRALPMLRWDRRENELMIGSNSVGWHLVSRPTTCGDVRRLASALGIRLATTQVDPAAG